MSTESASFAEVLSRLQILVGGGPAPVAMPVAMPVAVLVSSPQAAPVAPGEEPPTFVRLGADPWPAPAPVGAPETLPQPVGSQRPVPPEPSPVLLSSPSFPSNRWFVSNPRHPCSREPLSITSPRRTTARGPPAQPRATGRSALHLGGERRAGGAGRAARRAGTRPRGRLRCPQPLQPRLFGWSPTARTADGTGAGPGHRRGGAASAAMRVARTLSSS